MMVQTKATAKLRPNAPQCAPMRPNAPRDEKNKEKLLCDVQGQFKIILGHFNPKLAKKKLKKPLNWTSVSWGALQYSTKARPKNFLVIQPYLVVQNESLTAATPRQQIILGFLN